MDARAFINKKYEAAVEDLKSLEAEFIPRRNAVQAKIDQTNQWLVELAMENSVKAPAATVAPATQATPLVVEVAAAPVQEVVKRPSNNWVSARDLTPQARQAILRQEQVA